MQTFILADNQDITKFGLKYLISSRASDIVISEADNKLALRNLLTTSPHSIVILDYTLFDLTSAAKLMILQERFPLSNWILFSEELSSELIKEIISNNHAFSFVTKTSKMDEIAKALDAASNQQQFICSSVKSQLDTAKQKLSNSTKLLTNSEKEILHAIALGKTTKEIASERNLSFHTITTHRKNIFRKLEVNNVHEAIKYAMRAGIVDVTDYYI